MAYRMVYRVGLNGLFKMIHVGAVVEKNIKNAMDSGLDKFF